MDTFRGQFGSTGSGWGGYDEDPFDAPDEVETPPSPVGQDERRMQVRAYNYWASLLGERSFPSIEALEPAELGDFGPYSVLLDFTAGIENPVVTFLGERLANECGTDHQIKRLNDVPARSLLSRITDHYMQILANEAPIGFEAEFVNQREANVMYRGILLPFSSNDETIDFIYGVINWKEMADQRTADELLLEIDQALDADSDIDGDDGDNVLDLGLVGVVADEDFDGRTVAEYAPAPEHDEPLDEIEGEPVDADAAFYDKGGDMFAAEDDGFEEVDEDGQPVFRQPDFGDDEDMTHEDYEEGVEGEDDHMPSLMGISIEKAEGKKPITPSIDFNDYAGDEDDEDDLFSAADLEIVPDESDAPVEGNWSDELPVSAAEFDDAEIGQSHDAEPEPEPEDAAPSQRDLPDMLSALFEKAEQIDRRAADDDAETDDREDEPVAAHRFAQDDILARIAEAMDAEPEDEGCALNDCLAMARESAAEAALKDDRSRAALYEAIERAYEVSIEAKKDEESFAELLSDNGLTVQERAPMTPIAKLVFGSHYDKTRLAEYAAVLSHAHRLDLPRDGVASHIRATEGGLKAIVAAERRAKREERGETAEKVVSIREKLAAKLRALEAKSLDDLGGGEEFALVLVRRTADGIVVLGEAEHNRAMIERVGRKLAS